MASLADGVTNIATSDTPSPLLTSELSSPARCLGWPHQTLRDTPPWLPCWPHLHRISSFYGCFPLTCGVIYLAAAEVVGGILTMFGYIWMATTQLPTLQDQYASQCEGATAEREGCTDLADLIGSLSVGLLLPTLLLWVVNIAGSMIGLWAVLYSNARAAKIFFQSRVLVFVMGQVNLFIHVIASSEPKTMEYLATIAFYSAFFALCSLYGIKVIWSYQMLLLRRSSRRQASLSSDAAAAEGMIELDGSSQIV
ncbi:unnamed protein product [Ectocarpus sp. 4 AP-2014]